MSNARDMLGAAATHERLSRLLRDAETASRAMAVALGGDVHADIVGAASPARVCVLAADAIATTADDYALNTAVYTHALGGVNDSEGYITAVERGNYAQRIACSVEQVCAAARAHDSAYVIAAQPQQQRGGRRIAAQPKQMFRNAAIGAAYRTLCDVIAECTGRISGIHAISGAIGSFNHALLVAASGDYGSEATDCICGANNAWARDDETSFWTCTACGRMRRIEGTAFRDDHTFSQEGVRARTSDYHAMRHFEEWLPKIMGTEKFDVDESVIAALRKVMQRDDILPTQLDCRTMRRMLKDRTVNATYLNEHSTLIIKRLGGRVPRELSFDDANLIRSKYRIIADLYRTIDDDGVNQKYCPYFIYKIIEMFFEDVPHVMHICKYIHLQSDATLNNNDAVLAKIIEKTSPDDGFRVIKTDSQK